MRTRKPVALFITALVVLLVWAGAGTAMAQIATHLQNGEKFLTEGNWASAVTEFRYALNYEPQNTTAWYGLGRSFEGLSGAKEAFDQKVDGLTGESSGINWAPGADASANLAEAAKAYTNALSFFPTNQSAISPLARVQFMQGKVQEALLTLEKSFSPYLANGDLLSHILYIAILSGDTQRVTYYSQTAKASQVAMNDPAVVHALCAIEYAKGDYKAAEALLTPLMYRYDIGYLPLKAMGDVLLAQGRPIEALSFYRYAAGMNPKAVGALITSGDIISLTGDSANAAAAYRAVLVASPDSVWAKFGLARCLAETNDLNGALGMLNELVKTGGIDNLDSIYAYKAMVERKLGQLQQAELSLKSALVLNAGNSIATNYLNLVQTEMRSKGMSSLEFQGISVPAFDGFVINGGAKVTNNRKVELFVNTTAAYVAFRNEGSDYSAMSFKFGSTATYEWMLSETDGKKSVQMRTREGLFSLAKDGPVQEILLDSVAPAIGAREAQFSSGTTFIMKVEAKDALTGVSAFWLSVDGADWKLYKWIGNSFPFNMAQIPQNRMVTGSVLDKAGNFAPFQVDMSASVPGPVISNVTAQETGTGQVTVKWSTDRLANSYVEYRLGQSANTVGAQTSTKTHSVDVTGLVAGQTYQFKPISTDSYGLRTEGQPVSVTISVPAKGPVISGVNATNVTANSATITWNTDVVAYGYVVYTVGTQQLTTQQVGPSQYAQVTLTNLSQMTNYQYQIVAWDAAGRQSYSDPRSFSTLSSDRVAPIISAFRVSGNVNTTGNRTVGLELFASDDSGYVTEMSFRDDLTNWGQWQTYSTYTSFVLSDKDGLRTIYVRVRDSQGNVSAEASVKVTLDRTAPKISWVSAQAGADNAIVTWDTDENADSWVLFGSSSFSLTNTMGQADSVRSHRVTLSGLLPNTTYFYKVMSRDATGSSSESSPASFRTLQAVQSDTTAPTGSLSINDNSQYTRSRYIYLNLFATDNRSQQGEIQFRVGEGVSSFNISWGSWQQYTTRVLYTLSQQDGQRNIWVTYRDAAGNISQPYGASVTLDTRGPSITGLQAYNITTISAVIAFNTNELAFGSVEYGTANYSLSLVAGDSDVKSASVSSVEPSSVVITPNPVTSRPGMTSFNVTITGLKAGTTYYYRAVAQDLAGNVAATQVYSFQTAAPIPVDTKAPTGSLSINDNSQYTRSRYIYLNLFATDDRSQQGEIQFRVGEGISTYNINWGNWQQYTNRATYLLAAGDGQRNIWVTYRDAAGNISQPYGASVTLDTRAPSITGLQAYNVTTVSAVISFNTNEPALGSVEYGTANYSLNMIAGDNDVRSASISSVEPSSVVITPNPIASRPGMTSFNITITGLKANTTYYYRAIAQDLAGNVAGTQVYSFQTGAPVPVDTTPPTGSISVNNGSNYTRSRYVSLSLNATDNLTSQSQLQFRVGEGANSSNIGWGSWQQFSNTATYLMSAGDGQRNIWVSYKDTAGNTSPAYYDSIVLDTRAPGISSLAHSSVTQTSAVVSFRTDEQAFGSVEYGTVSYSLSMVSGETDVRSASISSVEPNSIVITPNQPSNRQGNTTFSFNITGLNPGTIYYYRAVAQDFAGNTSASQVASFTTLSAAPTDNTPPTGNIVINDGTRYTKSRFVSLGLYATDNASPQGALQFRIGEGASSTSINWGSWQAYASKVTYQLSAGDGQRNIWASYKDAANNVSQPYVASIILDTKVPVMTNVTSSGITQSGATISWNTNEPSFGSVEFGTSPSSVNSVSGEASVRSAQVSSVEPASVVITPESMYSRGGNTSFSLNLTGLSPNTTYYYKAVSMDLAGNVAASQTQSFKTAAITTPVTPPVITPPVVVPPIVVTPPVVTPPVVTPPVIPPTLVNLASRTQGTKAEANGYNGNNGPNFVIDGSASSFWESGSTPDESGAESLIITFNKAVSLNTVVLKVSSAGFPKAFKIRAIVNNKWVDIAEYKDGKPTGTAGALDSLIVSFNRITTTTIRIMFLDVYKKKDLVRVYEVEAYDK